ncbi:hypothetical protein Y032_0070g429 [Ancylostoma ceylanicum]|uniref:Major facilitator superfamily (MFS) profile domain-containing protein n=1 Tax=Ancylostoma ceylanicum TaxID=53326 RepID=A0A016TXD2_9BILA|nr:hypothetical protein Y032_0070g429 [Ancylostoma ceylanicum]
MNRYGRRIVVASSHLAAAVIFFGLIFSPEDAGVRTALWALGKFAISCSFMSIYVYASEIFPTNIRNLSIGFCEMMSRVGGILAPYVVVLGNKFRKLFERTVPHFHNPKKNVFQWQLSLLF